MSDNGRSRRMKSAYEIALERLEEQGVSRPRAGALSDETKSLLGQVRARAEASLAELEILHRDRLRKAVEPDARAQEEETYLDERRRIEERRDRDIEKLRASHRDNA